MTTNTPDLPATIAPIDVLARALDDLGRHAAIMDQRDEEWHEDCLYCQTMILFSRVASFGEGLRKAEKARR